MSEVLRENITTTLQPMDSGITKIRGNQYPWLG